LSWNKFLHTGILRFVLLAILGVVAWQFFPDRYLGPYKAWNPHAIMEFVIAIFAISLLGRLAIHLLGAHYGLLLSGLMGGFVFFVLVAG